MISDTLSDAVGDIEEYQRGMPKAYADLAAQISVVKTVMDSLRIVLDAATCQSDVFRKLVEELRASIRAVDVSLLVAARDRLLAWVKEAQGRLSHAPEQDDGDPAEPSDDGWQPLGAVTIDTGRLLLVDPVHQGRVDAAEDGQIAIPGGDLSAVQVPTGIGDGRYRVEGRFLDSPLFGRRLAEIRMRFLDELGNWLGGDEPTGSDDEEGVQ